jgi:ubiquinone/menaquinone biosynthesis C-methylase UbiE
VPWDIFERAAGRYEAWYTTPRGRRADAAERALLGRLLRGFSEARHVLEVGCGTGHFTRWLAGQGWHVVGLDRAPAMLAEMHRSSPEIPLILSDAHPLPLPAGAVDLVVFVTTLEFLQEPSLALVEPGRVARQGLVVVALNPWSLGGLSRRWGRQARQPLLSQVREISLVSLRAMIKASIGPRLQGIEWASTLFPDGLWRAQARLPLGEVVGIAAHMTGKEGGR